MKNQLSDFLQVSFELYFAKPIEMTVFPSLSHTGYKTITENHIPGRTAQELQQWKHDSIYSVHTETEVRHTKLPWECRSATKVDYNKAIVLSWITIPLTSPKLPCKVNEIIVSNYHLNIRGEKYPQNYRHVNSCWCRPDFLQLI